MQLPKNSPGNTRKNLTVKTSPELSLENSPPPWTDSQTQQLHYCSPRLHIILPQLNSSSSPFDVSSPGSSSIIHY
ncbi:hypothetical protein ATANTOWER_005459 [Ataeniobius toweri]|uniref:Uncharacterized protein n=1 Tax=Ataeniobius toweri TaxID=208326 RepID=A0ABU7AX90_9TELE|nr:hypothetical protein [Ataeniobius toweri]